MSIVGTYPAERKPAGVRQLVVSSDIVSLADATGGIPDFANRAVVVIEDDDIRWTDDGQDPTSTFGILYGPTASLSRFELVSREQIEAFQAIRVTTDAELNISYYKA